MILLQKRWFSFMPKRDLIIVVKSSSNSLYASKQTTVVSAMFWYLKQTFCMKFFNKDPFHHLEVDPFQITQFRSFTNGLYNDLASWERHITDVPLWTIGYSKTSSFSSTAIWITQSTYRFGRLLGTYKQMNQSYLTIFTKTINIPRILMPALSLTLIQQL